MKVAQFPGQRGDNLHTVFFQHYISIYIVLKKSVVLPLILIMDYSILEEFKISLRVKRCYRIQSCGVWYYCL